MDWENVAMIEYINCFTNKDVSERELKGTRDVNAMLNRNYKRYQCFTENIFKITLDLEPMLCEQMCFLDSENYNLCPNGHTGEISIFRDKNFQKNIVNLYDELEKYP